ncbi:hypothetical protein EDD11_004858 [Mortierella claussenii]|nr:hypothetical protein EDD11_004858 [Mortierella claussenii]
MTNVKTTINTRAGIQSSERIQGQKSSSDNCKDQELVTFANTFSITRERKMRGAYLAIANEASDAGDVELGNDMRRMWDSEEQQKLLQQYLKAEAYKSSKRRFSNQPGQSSRRPEQVNQSDLSSELDHQEGLPRKKEQGTPCPRWTNLERPGATSNHVSGPHFVLDGVDITSKLMSKREQLIPKESELMHVHCLLALDFIFVEDFMHMCLPNDVVAQILKVNRLPPVMQDQVLLEECSVAALDGKKQLDETLEDILRRGGWESPMFLAIQLLSAPSALWNRNNRGSENDVTYQRHFVDPIFIAYFSGVDLTTARGQVRLPTPPDHMEDLFPSFFAMKSYLPLVVAVVKRPGASVEKKEKDRQKVLSMMKISLNMMLRKRVEDPVVIGVVVQDSFFEIMAMDLAHEALYIPKVLGSFQVPTCPGGLAALKSALPVLAAAKDCMVKTQESIDKHPMLISDFDDVRMRDSFYLRRAKTPKFQLKNKN